MDLILQDISTLCGQLKERKASLVRCQVEFRHLRERDKSEYYLLHENIASQAGVLYI